MTEPDHDQPARGIEAANAFEAFERRHGRPPDGVWCAPGRVNLIGEHTDYNGGRCLPIALERVTCAAIARRDDDRVTAWSLQAADGFDGPLEELAPVDIGGWHAYAVGVVWALREEVHDVPGVAVPGVDIVVSSGVPIGAGLSSSASLECSVALGLAELSGWTEVIDDPTLRRHLVEIGVRAEREVAGAPTGGLDQTVSLLASPDHALALDFDDGAVRHVPWRPVDDGVELVVIDTAVSHALADGGYEERRRECERAAIRLDVSMLSQASMNDVERLDDDVLLRRARHVLTENERVDEVIDAVGRGAWNEVGEWFTASHRSLRDDFEVSCAELDTVCELATQHGALGARMTGGGFGGSAIALVPDDRVADVFEAIEQGFGSRRWRRPAFLRTRAGDGARRIV